MISLSGEIDLATIPKLHDALTRAIASAEPSATVFVDLDGAYVCDDSGLGVMLGAAALTRPAGGEMVVVCSPGPLRDRLAQTGFDRAVTVIASLAHRDAAPTTTPD